MKDFFDANGAPRIPTHHHPEGSPTSSDGIGRERPWLLLDEAGRCVVDSGGKPVLRARWQAKGRAQRAKFERLEAAMEGPEPSAKWLSPVTFSPDDFRLPEASAGGSASVAPAAGGRPWASNASACRGHALGRTAAEKNEAAAAKSPTRSQRQEHSSSGAAATGGTAEIAAAAGSTEQRRVLDGFLLLDACGSDLPDRAREADVGGGLFTAVVAEDVTYFSQLERIDAGGNLLPFSAFSALPRLRELRLPCNGLTDLTPPPHALSKRGDDKFGGGGDTAHVENKFNEDEQSDEFKKCNARCGVKRLTGYSALMFLDLSYNALSQAALGALAGLPQLQELDLTCNGLWRLPAELTAARSLERLTLERNRFEDPQVLVLLAALPALRHLGLAYNYLTRLPMPAALAAGAAAAAAGAAPATHTGARGRFDAADTWEILGAAAAPIGGSLRPSSEPVIGAPAWEADGTGNKSWLPQSTGPHTLRSSAGRESSSAEATLQPQSPWLAPALAGSGSKSEAGRSSVSAAAPAAHAPLPEPFPRLEHLDLAFNYVRREEDTATALALPRLARLVLYGNPLLGPTGEDPEGLRVTALLAAADARAAAPWSPPGAAPIDVITEAPRPPGQPRRAGGEGGAGGGGFAGRCRRPYDGLGIAAVRESRLPLAAAFRAAGNATLARELQPEAGRRRNGGNGGGGRNSWETSPQSTTAAATAAAAVGAAASGGNSGPIVREDEATFVTGLHIEFSGPEGDSGDGGQSHPVVTDGSNAGSGGSNSGGGGGARKSGNIAIGDSGGATRSRGGRGSGARGSSSGVGGSGDGGDGRRCSVRDEDGLMAGALRHATSLLRHPLERPSAADPARLRLAIMALRQALRHPVSSSHDVHLTGGHVVPCKILDGAGRPNAAFRARELPRRAFALRGDGGGRAGGGFRGRAGGCYGGGGGIFESHSTLTNLDAVGERWRARHGFAHGAGAETVGPARSTAVAAASARLATLDCVVDSMNAGMDALALERRALADVDAGQLGLSNLVAMVAQAIDECEQ